MDKNYSNTLLAEVAWEVCNQIGGIYTVIRSKAPAMIKKWGDNYCAIGPYFPSKAGIEFEETDNYDDAFGQAVLRLREKGIEVHYGNWLVSGSPKVVLINPFSVYDKLVELKYILWERHYIPSDHADDLQHQVIAFGYVCKEFLRELADVNGHKILAHFHEWMVGVAIPDIRFEKIPATCIFTTHATLLGRYLAMNDANFYDNLSIYNWHYESKKFNIEAAVLIERAAAHGSQVFTTISEFTARECVSLLGREPDVLLPNGINIERFTAMHEHQILHQKYKEQINQFVMGHYFQSYSFDLDKTLYFFTSGRFEYRNKGYDISLEALARLNHMLKANDVDMNVVMFFITPRPFISINPEVLHTRSMMEEIGETTEAIQKQIGEKLFHAVAATQTLKLPDLNEFVSDYWKLRLRRNLQAWKWKGLPLIVTHNLVDHDHDELLNFIRTTNLVNKQEDKVKIVYHPDFIAHTNPLFKMDYNQFVRGCHLGIFPSYYEPWGYTPLEAMASGVPAVTSDLAGFGAYVAANINNPAKKGIYVVNRYHKSFEESSQQLADMMYKFVNQTRRERINQRNRVESASEDFDWNKLTENYDEAYRIAIEAVE